MKTNLIRTTIVSILLLLADYGYSQGTFGNLNFENPIITWDPSAPSTAVPIANALPGWSGYIGPNQTGLVIYNTINIGAAGISLQSPASLQPPIEGNYSVILQPQFPGLTNVGIAQTGQIPLNAQSLIFYSGSESMQLSFVGQTIPLTQLAVEGGGPTRHLVLGADISSFAGQTGELRFTMPSVAFSFNIPYLDNIQFSSQPIPEPSVFGLFALGALLLGWRFFKKQR